jgi:hypothetical protein
LWWSPHAWSWRENVWKLSDIWEFPDVWKFPDTWKLTDGREVGDRWSWELGSLMVSQACGKFLKADGTTLVRIKSSEKRGDPVCRGFTEVGNGSEFLKREFSVITSDFSKLFGALLANLRADFVASSFTLLIRDDAISIGVNLSATSFASSLPSLADRLAFFFIDLAILVDVILLEKLRKGSISKGFVICVGQ